MSIREPFVSIDIAAPTQRVWEIMSDVEHWPQWTASISSVERLDAASTGTLVVGSRARIRQPGLPPAIWMVTELEPGRCFVWISRGPGVLVTARHLVEPTAAGSKATLGLRFSGLLGGLLAHMTHGLNMRYLHMEAGGLKKRSESV